MTPRETSVLDMIIAKIDEHHAEAMRSRDGIKADLRSLNEKMDAAHNEHDRRIGEIETLRSNIGSVVLAFGFVISALAVPLSIFWSKLWAWVVGS
jgi:hypothetical protein